MSCRQRIAACFLLAGVVYAIGPTAKTTWGTLQGIEQSTLSDAPFYRSESGKKSRCPNIT